MHLTLQPNTDWDLRVQDLQVTAGSAGLELNATTCTVASKNGSGNSQGNNASDVLLSPSQTANPIMFSTVMLVNHATVPTWDTP